MRNIAVASLLALFCGCATAPKALVEPHPDTPAYPWKPLFAKDLSDAEFAKGAWCWDGDILYSVKDTPIWTKADYENYVLDFEYAMEKDGNSGVFIYISNLDKFPKYKIEIQLLDDNSEKFKGKELPYQQSGSLYGRAPAVEIASKNAGEWNRMTAFCAGKNIHIILNGKVVVDANLDDWKNPAINPDGTPVPPWHRGFPALSTIPTYGRVGFQGVHGKAGVKIRNLRIASLGNAASKQELKLACQMWSVKDLWFGKADKIAAFAEIFPKIKELGYAGVQCGAFIRLDQDKLEKVLKDNGLVIVDQPVNMTDLDNEENLNKTIAFCKRFGVDFVYIPWYSSKTVAGWKDFCGKLNAVEAKLAKNGIKVGYHHHIDELTKKVEGVYPWDILTSAEGVRHELDIGPILESARVPAEEIKRLRGRLPGGIHAKPVGATAAGAPGEKHDWPRIVAAASKAGVKWLVVECEKRQNTFEDVAASAKYLRPLLTVANEMK